MKLLFVRHGDPDYENDSLTPQGWHEAKLLSERLAKLSVKNFYCSPLGRAKDTASVTLKEVSREAEILPWLREFSPQMMHPHGVVTIAWDWLPEDWTKCPEFFDRERWADHPLFVEANVREAAREVEDGIDSLLKIHGYARDGLFYRAEKANEDRLVFFCHFGVECVVLSHLLNVSPMILWHGACAAPSSVTTVVTEERRKGIAYFRMLSFGDTAHLYVAGEEPSFHARFCETFDNAEQRH